MHLEVAEKDRCPLRGALIYAHLNLPLGALEVPDGSESQAGFSHPEGP